MRPAHPTERAVGIEYYVSDTDGVGGRLRETDADFRVRELERFSTEPIDAPADAYPHVVVRATLRGWETNDFAARLSNALGMSRERVSWAGTKDKYAVTTQLFSIRGIDPADLPSIDGVELDVLGRAGRSIEFGDLAGNAFEIVVSDPVRPDNAAPITDELADFGGLESDRSASESRTSIGVPNVFGQQRFGSRRPVTHEVGLAVVREDWEGAVMAYLGAPTNAEPEDTQSARRFVEETRDWSAALERFPNRLGYERSMLHELAETDGAPGPETFRAALERVPTSLQRMFVHAAQSYAFNLMLSARLDHGLPFDRPVEGDVVCFAETERVETSTDSGHSEAGRSLVVPDVDRRQRVDARRVETVTRHCDRGRAFVTAPLVGTETELATGEQGTIERAVLDDLDLEPGDFDLPGHFHSTGTRRAILVRTDVAVERDPLTLSFALPKGSYATAIAREYLKVDPTQVS